VRFTHIGAATALLEVGPLRLLTDPAFDPPGTRHSLPNRLLPIGSTRTAGPALSPGQLGRIDAVLLSHDQHFDNLDDAGRQVLGDATTVITTEAGAARLGGTAVGCAPWQSTDLPGAVRITATPGRHGPPLLARHAGPVVGFVIESPHAPTVYVSGDTVWFAGVREVAQRYRVGVALLHVGAARFRATGPVRFTMNAREAARAAAALGAGTVVPIHTEGWSHFREGVGAVETEFRRRGLSDRLVVPRPGEPIELPA
jgi:L-ascorbate metabolism protein UlaG (beta-lactamase superfamily)